MSRRSSGNRAEIGQARLFAFARVHSILSAARAHETGTSAGDLPACTLLSLCAPDTETKPYAGALCRQRLSRPLTADKGGPFLYPNLVLGTPPVLTHFFSRRVYTGCSVRVPAIRLRPVLRAGSQARPLLIFDVRYSSRKEKTRIWNDVCCLGIAGSLVYLSYLKDLLKCIDTL